MKLQTEKTQGRDFTNWEFLCQQFQAQLIQEEKSIHTIQKYLHDTRKFLAFLKDQPISKEIVLNYKESLIQSYQISSVNSMLASLNSFLQAAGYAQFKVKTIRTQKRLFCRENDILHRKEYEGLLRQAKHEGKEQLAMIMRTIGCTGIRISELQFLTLEAVKKGTLQILNKGKYREILFPCRLREKLLDYAQRQGISGGRLFITRSGAPIDRSNLWRQMKSLASRARLNPQKVFPHNFRHMFARLYYQQEKDIVKLADLLGHSSLSTTRIYIISTGTEHQQQMDAMNLAG